MAACGVSAEVLERCIFIKYSTRTRVGVGENLINIMAEETDEGTASGTETDVTAVADTENEGDWVSDGVHAGLRRGAALDALMQHMVDN